MPAGTLSFLVNFFSLKKFEGKVKSRTSSSSDIDFEAVIKHLFNRYLFNIILLKLRGIYSIKN